MICRKFIVKGLVQGVGYRYFALRKAHELMLNGYAKNLFDGSVEVVAEGSEQAIEQFHKYLIQGPTRSDVSLCLYDDLPFKSQYDDFLIY